MVPIRLHQSSQTASTTFHDSLNTIEIGKGCGTDLPIRKYQDGSIVRTGYVFVKAKQVR